MDTFRSVAKQRGNAYFVRGTQVVRWNSKMTEGKGPGCEYKYETEFCIRFESQPKPVFR